MNYLTPILAVLGLVLLALSLAGYKIVATYKITYAPHDSTNPKLPIQTYVIAGHPRHLARKSIAGDKYFTGFLPRPSLFRSFRADRTLSVNLHGFVLLSPSGVKSYQSTLFTPPAQNITVAVAG